VAHGCTLLLGHPAMQWLLLLGHILALLLPLLLVPPGVQVLLIVG
jgi:hypothetical protein